MKLTGLKGIGEKTEKAFERLGIMSVEDLLEFYPRDFEIFSEPVPVMGIGYKTFAAVRGIFTDPPVSRRIGKLSITNVILKDEIGGSVRVTWFNAPFMKDSIRTGKTYVVRGRISRKRGVLQIDQPKLYSPEEYDLKMHAFQPVYQQTKGLSSLQIAKAVKAAFESGSFQEMIDSDPLPEAVRTKNSLCSREEMIRGMHFPKTRQDLETALRRAAYEEIFVFIMTMKRAESSIRPAAGVVINPDERTLQVLDSLPFELTGAQQKVIAEIAADMSSGKVMNRLVQGDVGSGKTMVALAACMNAAFAGYQSAFMAPTEVLANQHFETMTRLFREHGTDIHAGLLTGSMTALEKKVVYDALEDGRIDIVVGTHALFQEKVNYRNLALIITDEQHRFGIKQREALAGKGVDPHMVVMSATPIPRTLALIVYGNMDVSVIDEVPGKRLPIKNAVIDDSYKDNAYRLIEREVRAGHQAYIICPLVEYSEGCEAQNVEDYTEMLRDVMSEDISIGMLHGQMKPAQKNEIMAAFAEGRIQVLVSTTVVEVGVDVPNATVMMIEDANRFGLAALHQLRGRVGRGDSQSYCIFVCNSRSDSAKERLEILKTSNNGFEIAAKDLELRGPGEFLGIRQSGELSFRNFDLYRDADIAVRAKEDATEILDGKMELSEREQRILFEKTDKKAGTILL